MTTYQQTAGRFTPLGATVDGDGTNFALFSRHATRVWLHLFDQPDSDRPSHTVELQRTEDIWHTHLSNVKHQQLYLYQIDGPYKPHEGHRFNRHKPLLDPYAKAIVNGSAWEFESAYGYDRTSAEGDLSFSTVTDFGTMPKCVVYGDDGFDWQGATRPQRPLNETIIYETHVRGLTRHDSAAVQQPGTFGGLIEKIPYFKQLGVTAIELLPVHQFNTLELERYNPDTGERLGNYWGYQTLNFFAPHAAYSQYDEPGGVVVAFKEMVRALHQAGLEIILDVVFNHTVEGNHDGVTVSFKGIDNSIYYSLQNDPRFYVDTTGVFNTVNANHPIVQDFIIDCLRYWVHEMQVDGFRFDLSTSLSRGESGTLLANPPLIQRISEDPYLRTVKLIAEPWDIAGYQVGNFPTKRWSEWNDKYRDQVRQFWRGDEGLVSQLATRLAGSSDLYDNGRSPLHSINLITAHDGFTLNDLVSYNDKHNEMNGDHNSDGHDHNISFNYGVEGPTDDPTIEATRLRQIKNFLATLLLSQGVPMLTGGDEFRRTQQGNNNAYCQDNAISWYDWDLLKKYADVFRFVQQVIALRQAHPIFRRTHFLTGEDLSGKQWADVRWYGPELTDPDWDSRLLMCLLSGARENIQAGRDDANVVMMFNADFQPHEFNLIPPPDSTTRWHVVLNTGVASPGDIHPPGQEVAIDWTQPFLVGARSMVVLLSKHLGYHLD